MRILRLDLLAFGPFTRRSLVFEQGHSSLHLVYGPNEAGKSSSLRALRQWLYGMPHSSPDSFLHANQNLRIGGVLESANGGRLEFIRRKGRTNTLRAADDVAVLDEARLAVMLGGVDQETFSQRFGIDYDELCRGGEAVVRGGGDLGDILFAAGAGIADLGLIQERLAGEADTLFKPRGSTQQINKAISELDGARRTIREALLPTTEWVQADEALRAAETRRSDIDRQLAEARGERSRLQRIASALSEIGRRKHVAAQLAQLSDAPLLPPAFSELRNRRVNELRMLREQALDATRVLDKLREQMAAVNVPAELPAHRTAIAALYKGLGSHQKAAKDRPALAARLEEAARRVQQILDELGREPRAGRREPVQLGREQRRHIQSLAGDWKVRHEGRSTAARAVAKAQEATRRTEAELATLPAARNAVELRQAIRRAQRQGDLDSQLAETRAALRQFEEQAAIDLGKLPFWTDSLADLEKLPVPALETVERFEGSLTDARSQAAKWRELVEAAERECVQLEQSLERLRLEHDVPTEDDLRRARLRRDDAWQTVRRLWLGDPADNSPHGIPAQDDSANDDRARDDSAAKGPAAGDSATHAEQARALEAGMAGADTIADRLRREADRVAERARMTADRQKLQRELQDRMEAAEAAARDVAHVEAAWRAAWQAVGIEPLTPREMRSWLNQQRALIGLAEDIRKQRAAVSDLEGRMDSLHEELRRRLEPLGRTLPDAASTLAQAVECAESFADEIESANQHRERLERELEKLRLELHDAQLDVRQADDDLQQWEADWERAVATLGLERDARPAEANAVMELLEQLTASREEVAELEERLEGIDRDAAEFTDSVRQLTSQTAPDMQTLPVERAMADLYDRLEEAGKAQTKLEAWNEQCEAEQAKKDRACSQAEQIQQELDAMCREAGCDSPDDLPGVEQRSAARRETEQQWSNATQRLTELAAGAPLDAFVAEAEQFDRDRLEADLQRLADRVVELEADLKAVAEEVGSHRNDLRRMDGSDRAAAAQEQVESLLAGVRADVEQYVRLRLAGAVLRRAIERFRDASQGPVLDRASDWFATLTLGSFSGLRADYDDKGNAVLLGIRAGGGQAVAVEGMSGGTCDQLYLALRLTLLETYLNAHEPLPFILDDILVMFDDDRAVAALKALARLAEKTQAVFFTHHEHLLDLARNHVGHGAVTIHAL